MKIFEYLGISFYSLFILLIVLASILIRKNRFSVSYRIFAILVMLAAVVQLIEIASWIVLEKTESYSIILYFLSFIYHLLGVLIGSVYLCYIDYQLFGSLSRLKKRIFYLHLFIVFLVILLAGIGSGAVFTVNAEGDYVRGPAFMLGNFFNYALLLYGLLLVSLRAKTTEKRVFLTVILFTVLPVAGTILQLKFFGLNLGWPSISAAILITYIFLEIQQESRDYLTGLYNRQQVDEIISYRMRRKAVEDFTLVMIDLNDFKLINDLHGHDAGDCALVSFSGILMRNTKRTDLAARFAGDEFLLVLDRVSAEQTLGIVGRLQSALDFENKKNGLPYDISFSWGAAVHDPEKHDGYSSLLQEADAAMYRNKAESKGK